MGRTEHGVDRVGPGRQNFREGREDVLDPLTWGEEAEGEQEFVCLEAEPLPRGRRIQKRHVGDAMRDDVDPVVIHAVPIAKQQPAPLCHHGQPS